MSASDRQVGGNHYKDMDIQPGEFIVRNGLGWHEGNAVKYICRHHLKGGAQDIDKAIHYLELLKELLYERKGSNQAAVDFAEQGHTEGGSGGTYEADRVPCIRGGTCK